MTADEDGTQFTLAPQISSRFCLKGVSGLHEGKMFVLSENTKFGRTVIGRSKDCSIIIDAPGVSREHAAIQLKDGIVVVTDLGSSNGTYVDDARIQQVLIAPGQKVAFEKQAFILEQVGPAQIAQRDGAEESATAVMRVPTQDSRTASRRAETHTWTAILIIAILIAAGAVALAWYYTSG